MDEFLALVTTYSVFWEEQATNGLTEPSAIVQMEALRREADALGGSAVQNILFGNRPNQAAAKTIYSMQDFQVKVEKKPKAEEIARKQISDSNKLS